MRSPRVTIPISLRSISFHFVLPILIILLAGTLTVFRSSYACPFCQALSNTLTESLNDSQFAVLATCVSPPAEGTAEDLPIYHFKIKSWIKGKEETIDQNIEVLSFRKILAGETCFLIGIKDGEKIDWAPSDPVTQAAENYLLNLPAPQITADIRLKYFYANLESADPVVADDAYSELARATLKDLGKLKPHLKHDQILSRLNDSSISTQRRSLYWTLLSVCGSANDLPFIEEVIQKRAEAGASDINMEAVFFCYLKLGEEKSLLDIESKYFKNNDSDYSDTYAAIVAVRILSEETNIFSRTRIIEAFRLIIDRPALADLVIPDLARREDWSLINRFLQMFRSEDSSSQFVKVPIVNYLRSCPLPEAAEALRQCQEHDPAAVRRAEILVPQIK